MEVINGSYREHKKWVEEVLLQNLTTMSRAKGGGITKKKKHDMQERPGYTKVIGRPGS